MAINKATLVKEVDGNIEYIYPKTTADIVEYSTEVSVKDKLDDLADAKSEIIAARTAKSDNEAKGSLKARIDADFTAMNNNMSSAITDAIRDALTEAKDYADSVAGDVEYQEKPIATTTILYYTKSVNTPAPTAPSEHVTSTSTSHGVWTTKVPTYDTAYKYYFTCAEYKYTDNTYGWGPVYYNSELSAAVENSYVIGELTSIENGEVSIRNDALYVDKEFVSSLFGYEITVPDNMGGSIKGPVIISNNYNGTVSNNNDIKNYATDNTAGSILKLTNGTFNFSNKIKWDGSNLTIAANNITIGGVNAATTDNVTAAKNEAIAAAAQNVNTTIDTLTTTLNNNISSAIQAAELGSDKVIVSATPLFYLSNSNVNTPAAPNAHVVNESTTHGEWTTKVPTYDTTYKYYYTCTEYEYEDTPNNTYGWSNVIYNAELSVASADKYILDELTTIQNGEVSIRNGALYVDTQFVNSLFGYQISVPSSGSITGGTFNGGVIKSLNYGSLTDNTKDYSNTVGSIINLNNGTLNIGGGSMVFDGTALSIRTGYIGGFQIGFERNAYLMRADVTDNSNVTHQYAFQAPDADGTTSNAFYIREKASGANTWTYNFRVRYDGYMEATKGDIAGFTIGTNLLRKVSTIHYSNTSVPVCKKDPNNEDIGVPGTVSGDYSSRYFIQAPDGAVSDGTSNVFAAQYRPNSNSEWITLFRARYDGHVICNGLRSYNTIRAFGPIVLSDFAKTGSGNNTKYSEKSFITIAMRGDNSDIPIIRCEDNGVAYLGSSSYKWKHVYCSDGAFNGSDKKIKNHIEYLVNDDNLEDFFYGLKPVMYTLKNGEGHRHHMGLYAQDVSEIANETIGDLAAYQATVISHNEYGENVEQYYDSTVDDSQLIWSLNYSELVAPTIAIVQKQHARINQLESENEDLKSRLETVESKLALLFDE